MSFHRNPLIPTWNCGKGKHLKAKSKGNVKDISRFLLERPLRGLPEATPNGSV